jgi:PKHD-type hydroxylase
VFFIVDDILTVADLRRAQTLIGQAKFVDGLVTAAGPGKRLKANVEMEVSERYLSLVELLDRAIESSDELGMRLFPRFRTNPIVNRYDVGMFYDVHVDAPIQGGTTQFGRASGRFGQNFIRTDYSMTLFLSDPSTYDGGELELRLHGEAKRIKLRAGSAVCYSTGIPHCVHTVTKGTRIAAIYWFQSLIRDVQVRSVIWEQYLLERQLRTAGLEEHAQKAATIRSNLIRYMAEL